MRPLGTTLAILIMVGAGSPTLACDQGAARPRPGGTAATPATGYTRERCWPNAVRPSPAIGAPGKTAGTHNKTAGTHNKTAGTHNKTAGTHNKTAGTHNKTAGTHNKTAGTHKNARDRFPVGIRF